MQTNVSSWVTYLFSLEALPERAFTARGIDTHRSSTCRQLPSPPLRNTAPLHEMSWTGLETHATRTRTTRNKRGEEKVETTSSRTKVSAPPRSSVRLPSHDSGLKGDRVENSSATNAGKATETRDMACNITLCCCAALDGLQAQMLILAMMERKHPIWPSGQDCAEEYQFRPARLISWATRARVEAGQRIDGPARPRERRSREGGAARRGLVFVP